MLSWTGLRLGPCLPEDCCRWQGGKLREVVLIVLQYLCGPAMAWKLEDRDST